MRWLLFEHLYNRKIYFSQFVIEMSVYFTFNQKKQYRFMYATLCTITENLRSR